MTVTRRLETVWLPRLTATLCDIRVLASIHVSQILYHICLWPESWVQKGCCLAIRNNYFSLIQMETWISTRVFKLCSLKRRVSSYLSSL